MKKELTSSEIKKAELDILIAFDEFCREHKLRYFLSSGTLLGAIRHKGFIPWDDDIDVSMPRPDYEKFYELTKFNPIQKKFITSVYRKCLNKTYFPFMKIVDISTHISEDPKKTRGIQGLWIDIFPIDGWPKNSQKIFSKYMHIFKKYNFLRTKIIYKVNCQNFLKYIIKQSLWIIFSPVIPFLLKKMDYLMKKQKFMDSDFVFESLWPSNNRKKLPQNLFSPHTHSIHTEFENYQFCIPSNYDFYLKTFFGNYMQIPPVDAQKGHNFKAWKISSPKKVLAVGVFDLLHYGHFELFRRAKEIAGEDGRLIIAIQEDDFVTKYKPNTKLFYNWNTRAKMVSALKYVDKVVPYTNIDTSIKSIDFDIFVVGGDQNHEGFQRAIEWSKKEGKDVVVLSRTDGVSSSMLRGSF